MKRNLTVDERDERHSMLRRMLLDRHAEIKNKLRVLREMMPAKSSDVKDAEEQSMEDFVRDMDVALVQMESETLRRIDEALLRLKDGIYGICASCEVKISPARLQALPFATLCRDCQEREEEDETAARGPRRSAYTEAPPREEKGGRPRAAMLQDPSLARTLRLVRTRA